MKTTIRLLINIIILTLIVGVFYFAAWKYQDYLIRKPYGIRSDLFNRPENYNLPKQYLEHFDGFHAKGGV